jgi:hypothetical protein
MIAGVIASSVVSLLLTFSHQGVITKEQFLSSEAVVSLSEIGGEEEANALFDCLSGSVYGVWYTDSSKYLVCPGYNLPAAGVLQVGKVRLTQRTAREGSWVAIPWVAYDNTNYWMAFVLARGFDMWFEGPCKDLFPVVDQELANNPDLGKWKGAIVTYETDGLECLPRIIGSGNIAVVVSPYSVSVSQTDLSEFSPPTSSQDVPSEVVGLQPISLLPAPVYLRGEIYDVLAIFGGVVVLWVAGVWAFLFLAERQA